MANFNQTPSGQATVTATMVGFGTLALSNAAAATTAALMPRRRYVRPPDGRRVSLQVPEPR
jgi:hypothetical protein